MPDLNLSLDPVDLITVDAIGKPGNRVFYILGRQGTLEVSLVIEKIQLQSLIVAVSEFLKEVKNKFPDLPSPEIDINEESMRIKPPVDPKFRVGNMGLAYDDERDMACVIASEIGLTGEEGEEDGLLEGNAVRYWCTRGQLLNLANWSAIVIERGRAICPQCLQPMEPEGHFCPKKNGHKKPVKE
jgi:uncharacterized repeat protein (TIGR03847 family)